MIVAVMVRIVVTDLKAWHNASEDDEGNDVSNGMTLTVSHTPKNSHSFRKFILHELI